MIPSLVVFKTFESLFSSDEMVSMTAEAADFESTAMGR